MTDLPPELRNADETPDPHREEIAGTASGMNPRWLVPTMVALMVIGILWVVVYYVTQGEYPVAAWGYYNVAAGMGFLLAGFLLATRWQ
ncbi:cell division protein CrgA [Kytococcus sp. Marseille-QA3725]